MRRAGANSAICDPPRFGLPEYFLPLELIELPLLCDF